MKQYIQKGAPQYKANLHSHTVLSDGRLTPAEMKQAYREHGYSILAITDHERPYDHSALTERDFLMLTGYEVYIRRWPDARYEPYGQEIHINLFARDPHNVSYINFNEDYCKYIADPAERAALHKVGSTEPRVYSADYVNRFVQEAIRNGYICSYNHPVWSMEDIDRLLQYQGFFSMEMCNYSNCVTGLDEYNNALYQMLLRKGKRLFTHSTDDNHNKFPLDSPRSDSFGGFTMVLSDELSYDSVFHALETGAFYSSMGPVIRELTFDGTHVHVETDPVRQLTLHDGSKAPRSANGTPGCPVTAADFEIPARAPYVQLSAVDFSGRHADTRGFFRDEFENF